MKEKSINKILNIINKDLAFDLIVWNSGETPVDTTLMSKETKRRYTSFYFGYLLGSGQIKKLKKLAIELKFE